MRLKKLTIQIPAELHKTLRIVSAETERSMTDIIITAVEEYLRRLEKEEKENGEHNL